MKILKLFVAILTGVVALGLMLPVTIQADPPSPTPQAQKGAIQPASERLETGASAIPLSPTESDPPISTEALRSTNLPVVVQYDGETESLREIDSTSPAVQALGPTDVGAANLTRLLTETFEAGISNPLLFELTDGNGSNGGVYSWGRRNCFSTTGFPVEFVGNFSAWVAGTTITDTVLNPCPGTDDTYPKNMNAWLVYGPVDLQDARDASLDFFYRFDSPDPDDYLFWGASVDGFNFEGYRLFTDTFTSGPFPSGHNFVTFDLTDVPILGDLTGQPQVYVAFLFVSDGDSNSGAGAFIDSISLRKNSGTKQEITIEPFENTFPTGYESWLSHDNNQFSGGNLRWGSADCNAQSGSKSMWFARYGAEGFDPCSTSSFSATLRGKDFDSWLLYGPFSLENASEAYVDFYFRGDTEQDTPGSTITSTDDIFYWWASIDGTNYFGPGLSGTHLDGPYGSGHNLMRNDLSNVSGLGDLRGQKDVWIAFVLDSDFDDDFGQATEEGIFLDDVKVIMFEEGPKALGPNAHFLPVVIKPAPPEVGGITFRNFTGNPVVIELIDGPRRRFPGSTGPHVWEGIPAGEYEWVASGTCPAGAGQVGSEVSGRPEVTIEAGELDNEINRRSDGSVNVFDCSG